MQRVRALRHLVEHALRGGGPDARQQMQDAKTGDAVARILGKAQQRQHVLDMRGVEEFQPAELDEGDVAAGQLDFERAGMRGGAEQHRLVLEQRALLAIGQHLLDDVAGLVGLVVHGDELRLLRGGAVGPEVLGEALARKPDDAVGRRQHRLRRAVIAVERDHLRARREALRKIQDVAHGGGAERIDRLRVVADDGEPASIRLQRQQDRGLQAVGVLIFVDQHVIEAAADFVGDQRVAHHLRPVEQQVVVIEHVLGLLGLDVSRKQPLQFGGPACAPGIMRPEHLLDLHLGIDAARVDRQAGALGRKAALGLRQPAFVPDQIHQVGGILAVMDGEGGIDADPLGIFAQQPRADAVEGAGPGERVAHDRGVVLAQHFSGDALDPAGHLGGGAAGKRHQQDAARIGAGDDQMRDAVGERIGLAGTGAGNDEQGGAHGRAIGHAMLHGAALLRIERVQISRHESPR